jgi:hypothetical protein
VLNGVSRVLVLAIDSSLFSTLRVLNRLTRFYLFEIAFRAQLLRHILLIGEKCNLCGISQNLLNHLKQE